jgi:septum formation protein
MRLVLASQSPARLKLLREAGFAPEPIVSGVEEESYAAASPAELALILAHAKAFAVAERISAEEASGDGGGGSDGAAAAREHVGALIIGCDSVLDLDGVALGKPKDAADAVARWKTMRGGSGLLVSGHCLIDTRGGADSEQWRVAMDVAPTMVRFSDISDEEIDAYVATGEPLYVAGAFTIDGLGGSFVESIVGDASNVVGLSLPLLRKLLGEVGVTVPQLWARPEPSAAAGPTGPARK